MAVAGGRKFNPGFHLAFDLDNMLLVAESTAKSALLREESRGGHTRDDFPGMNNTWRQVNHISSFDGNQVNIKAQALPMLPKELFDLFDVHELEKYMTPEEIAKRRFQLMARKLNLRIWRGDSTDGGLKDVQVDVNEGEVVLDVIHRVQATQDGRLGSSLEL